MSNTFSDLVGNIAPSYHISNNLINCYRCSTHLNGVRGEVREISNFGIQPVTLSFSL